MVKEGLAIGSPSLGSESPRRGLSFLHLAKNDHKVIHVLRIQILSSKFIVKNFDVNQWVPEANVTCWGIYITFGGKSVTKRGATVTYWGNSLSVSAVSRIAPSEMVMSIIAKATCECWSPGIDQIVTYWGNPA
jgi:hypothetical protein